MDANGGDAATGLTTIEFLTPVGGGTPGARGASSLPSASGQAASPRVEVVAGSGLHLSDETRSLLRVRLRAMALAMTLAFGAFLVWQARGALAEAHGNGLVHRDLKPANIFAARRGNLHDFVKLLDFGLVLPPPGPASPEASRDGHVAGSPLYMAPEQATGVSRPDARADLYALGAVGYFLLTGGPPFAGPTALAVMVAAARDPVEPPSRRRPDLPADLERVILRCLAKEPAARPRDAEALERDLAACSAAPEWDFARAAAWWSDHERPPAGA